MIKSNAELMALAQQEALRQDAIRQAHAHFEARARRARMASGTDGALAAAALNAVLASPAGDALARWTAQTYNHNSSVYDAAIDAAYNTTHVGGSALHHLVDGHHTLAGAFDAAAGALPHDSLYDEVAGAVEHLLRDMASVSGINPLVSFEPSTLGSLQDGLAATLGVSRSWTADALTINAPEALGGSLGALSLVLGWRQADAVRFGRLAGSLGIAALLSANPLLGLVALAGAARAFHVRTRGQANAIAGAALGGAAVSGLVITALGLLPAWAGVALLAGLLLERFGAPLAETVRRWMETLSTPALATERA